MSRRHVSGLARLLLGALLFAQAAVAIAGCDFSQRSAARAIAAMGDTPCPAHGEPVVPDGNANLCLAHCTSDAQNVEAAGIAQLPSSPGVVLTVPLLPEASCVTARHPAAAAHAFAAPPVRILIHNLRI